MDAIRIIDNEHRSLPGCCTGRPAWSMGSTAAADGFAWTTQASRLFLDSESIKVLTHSDAPVFLLR